jgi:hypothetical protein
MKEGTFALLFKMLCSALSFTSRCSVLLLDLLLKISFGKKNRFLILSEKNQVHDWHFILQNNNIKLVLQDFNLQINITNFQIIIKRNMAPNNYHYNNETFNNFYQVNTNPNEKTTFYEGMKKQPYYMKYYGGNQKKFIQESNNTGNKKIYLQLELYKVKSKQTIFFNYESTL